MSQQPFAYSRYAQDINSRTDRYAPTTKASRSPTKGKADTGAILDQYLAKPFVNTLDSPKKRVKSDIDFQETFNRREMLSSGYVNTLEHMNSPKFGNGTRSSRSNNDVHDIYN